MRSLAFISLLTAAGCLSASVISDSVKIHFRQSQSKLDLDFRANRDALQRIADSLRTVDGDSILELRKVDVIGAASPEGSEAINRRLSERRAHRLFDYFSSSFSVPDTLLTFRFLGRDWAGLRSLVEGDADVPYRAEVLCLLDGILAEQSGEKRSAGDPLLRLKRLKNGVPYRYMYRELFPELRASTLEVSYERVPFRGVYIEPEDTAAAEMPPVCIEPVDTVGGDTVPAGTVAAEEKHCRPFYMDLRTNMLYDVAAVPNIGVEFYLGGNISVGANWQYAWWKTDRKHRYWRAYGGDVNVRWWFGSAAHGKPLTGHHLGVYGQVLTYDFEWGGKGCLGGKPGGPLWDKMNWGVGLEYGYSLPVAKRFNIDFTLGVGYLTGEYQEYRPVDGCYVWQATKQRHWFGPTKAEISLVWLIGCDNYNRRKGGER